MRNSNKSESKSHTSSVIGLKSDSSVFLVAASTMHAIIATLAIVVLACKMAAAGDMVWCYECTAGSADECNTSFLDTTLCSRFGYEFSLDKWKPKLDDFNYKWKPELDDYSDKWNADRNQDNYNKLIAELDQYSGKWKSGPILDTYEKWKAGQDQSLVKWIAELKQHYDKWKAELDKNNDKSKAEQDPYNDKWKPKHILDNYDKWDAKQDQIYEQWKAEQGQHNDELKAELDKNKDFKKAIARLDELEKQQVEIEEEAKKANAAQKQNLENLVQIDQKIENEKAENYQKNRDIVKKAFQETLKTFIEVYEEHTGEKIPADHALRSFKLIENDDTIPKEAQNERAFAWIKQFQHFLPKTEDYDNASIEAFNKRFSKEWKAAYDERAKKENGSGSERSDRQDGKHQYLISSYDTSDSWCATFESKELGFHRGCGVVVEGYEFKTGCHNMSGEYQGATYCRCDEDKCNDKASNDQDDNDDDYDEENEGVKLNGKITFILMATVLTHFM